MISRHQSPDSRIDIVSADPRSRARALLATTLPRQGELSLQDLTASGRSLFAELRSPHGELWRLTAFERMGDGRPRRIRGGRVRDLSARQRCIRIYLQREGDQR
jgi:hypothetical protein